MSNMPVSDELWCRAKRVIPMGTQTLSKAPDRFVEGVTPKFITRGEGAYVWDADGNKYIDYPCGLGAIILGHAYPAIIGAVIKALQKGNVFTLMSPQEGELATKLTKIIPCAEMVRFAKNGGDATMGAIRIARAYTNRDHIAFCGYHGCHDQMAITGGLTRGLPKVLGQLVHPFIYNDLENLEYVLTKNRCACVIMEQGLDEPKNGFLHKAIEMAHEHGALFILDEIVTGFRYALGGVQELYNIVPDLACIGKAMGNGLPISAIVGREEIMRVLEDGVFFSYTFAGEITAMEAAMAVIDTMENEPVIPTLWSNGAMLLSALKGIKYDVGMWCHGNPVRFIIKFMEDGKEDLMAKSYFLQETVKRGILMGVPTFTTYSHTREDIIHTIEVCDLVLSRMERIRGDYEHHLEGNPIQPPYVRA
jgi:glutamate-1-semialdehyde 2,1-aminomutase/spore coat polysaccharide biosynthesis protein SpsF